MHPEVQAGSIPYWFVVIVICFLGFLLVRFWFLVDELRKDIKALLIKDAARDAQLRSLTSDNEEYYSRLNEHDKKINFQQREIRRLQESNQNPIK